MTRINPFIPSLILARKRRETTPPNLRKNRKCRETTPPNLRMRPRNSISLTPPSLILVFKWRETTSKSEHKGRCNVSHCYTLGNDTTPPRRQNTGVQTATTSNLQYTDPANAELPYWRPIYRYYPRKQTVPYNRKRAAAWRSPSTLTALSRLGTTKRWCGQR